MNVILAVTGGIAAYKACDLINALRREGHDVRIIMTENAKNFITPMTLATLSKHPVMDNMWQEIKGTVDHIDVAVWAELFVVYPATANIIGKFANGIADDLLSTVFLALPQTTQKVVFPAMNTNMYRNPVVKRNRENLSENASTYVTSTRTGMLACNTEGEGCLLQPNKAVEILRAWLDKDKVVEEPIPSAKPLEKSEEQIKKDLQTYKEFVSGFGYGIKPPTFAQKFGYEVRYYRNGNGDIIGYETIYTSPGKE